MNADRERLVDPNDIHPSPSLSAIRHLSIRTPSPTPTGESSSTPKPVFPAKQPQPSPPTIASSPRSPVKPPSTQISSEVPPRRSSRPPSEVLPGRYRTAPTESSRPPSEAPQGRYHKTVTESSHPPSEAPQNGYKPPTESSRPPSEAPQRRYRPATERSYSQRSQWDRAGPSETTQRSVENDPTPRKSKLASLASSRLPSSRSKAPSEASESYISSSSFATYPDLRPKTLSSNSTSDFDSEQQREVDEAVRTGSVISADLYGARAKMIRATKVSVPYDPRSLPMIPPESTGDPISAKISEQPRAVKITSEKPLSKLASRSRSRRTPNVESAQLPRQEDPPIIEPMHPPVNWSTKPQVVRVPTPPTPKASSLRVVEVSNSPVATTSPPAFAGEILDPAANEAGLDSNVRQEVHASPGLKSILSEAEARRESIPSAADANIPEIPSPSGPAPTSKLALLAQARAAKREHTSRRIQKPKVLGPPYATTEYITPETDDSSMTTAITTYSQSLDNMVPLSRAKLPPSYPPEGDALDVAVKKQSKLAMKARKPPKKTPEQEALENAERAAAQFLRSRMEDPLYQYASGNAAAFPSSFAALLVDDSKRVKEEKARAKAEAKAERARQREEERMRRRQRKEALLPMHLLNPTVLKETAFAFDVPSPDDVVMDARRGTALGTDRQSTAASRKAASNKTPSLIASSVG